MYTPPVEFVPVQPDNTMRNIIISVVGFVGVAALLFFVGPMLLGGGPKPWGPSPKAEQWAPTSKNDFKYALYTLDLMYMAEDSCLPYMLIQKDEMPQTIDEMIQRGIVESRLGWDAWGNPVTFDGNTMLMASPGKDGEWGTPDDISHVFDAAPELPKAYWANGGMEEKAQAALMGDHVTQWQATIEMKRNALISGPAPARSGLGLAPHETGGTPRDEFSAVGSGGGSYNIDEGEGDAPTFDRNGNAIGGDSSSDDSSSYDDSSYDDSGTSDEGTEDPGVVEFSDE